MWRSKSKTEKVLSLMMRHSLFGQQLLGHFLQTRDPRAHPDYEYAEEKQTKALLAKEG